MARETTNTGKMGRLQQFSAAMEANKDELPHLEVSRGQLVTHLTQAQEAVKQQAAPPPIPPPPRPPSPPAEIVVCPQGRAPARPCFLLQPRTNPWKLPSSRCRLPSRQIPGSEPAEADNGTTEAALGRGGNLRPTSCPSGRLMPPLSSRIVRRDEIGVVPRRKDRWFRTARLTAAP